MEMERGNPKSRRRLETQLLHHHESGIWRGYSFAWNDQQTDATLVPAGGADRVLTVKDARAPGGSRRQTWHFPSRTECLTCHNPWGGPPLAFTMEQLNREHAKRHGHQLDLEARIASFELAARMQIAATDALDLSKESKETSICLATSYCFCRMAYMRELAPVYSRSLSAAGTTP